MKIYTSNDEDLPEELGEFDKKLRIWWTQSELIMGFHFSPVSFVAYEMMKSAAIASVFDSFAQAEATGKTISTRPEDIVQKIFDMAREFVRIARAGSDCDAPDAIEMKKINILLANIAKGEEK